MLPLLQFVPGVVTLSEALDIGWGEIEIITLCQTLGVDLSTSARLEKLSVVTKM